MAASAALHSPLSSCLALPRKPKPFSLCNSTVSNSSSSSASFFYRPTPFKSLLAFSSSISPISFPRGTGLMERMKERGRNPVRKLVVCEVAPKKKADSAMKRARQAEKRRIYNKAKKSEVRTRMRKVFEELDALRKKSDAQSEEILPVEELIADAYSAIDKAVKAGSLHRNTGAHRKSRLARRKKDVLIHHGWYTPVATA
ncbi:putative ribosomal protein S20 [Dioscorea sansibarensis]